MKGILCGILSAAAALSLCSAVFAAEVEITRAEQSFAGDVTVECTLSDASAGTGITVLACEYNDATYSKDIIYIDQFNASVTDGKFSFGFKPAQWTNTAKTYIVRVGGEDIDTPAQRIIAFYGVGVFSAGDINGDGIVDEADAKLLLAHISGTAVLSSAQLAAGDVHADTAIDMLDVIAILNKKN